MKKVFCIFFSLVMTAATLHISFAMHYCEGKEVDTKVSLSGKLASCTKECTERELPGQGTRFIKHCCEDVLSYCGLSCNYTPSYNYLSESYQYKFLVLAFPPELSVKYQTDINPLGSNISLPWALMSSNVDLSNICTFLI